MHVNLPLLNEVYGGLLNDLRQTFLIFQAKLFSCGSLLIPTKQRHHDMPDPDQLGPQQTDRSTLTNMLSSPAATVKAKRNI